MLMDYCSPRRLNQRTEAISMLFAAPHRDRYFLRTAGRADLAHWHDERCLQHAQHAALSDGAAGRAAPHRLQVAGGAAVHVAHKSTQTPASKPTTQPIR